MNALIAPFDRPPSDVRRLVADLMTDLQAIPDHWDRRGRVYPLSSLLAIHMLVTVGNGNSPQDAARQDSGLVDHQAAVSEKSNALTAICQRLADLDLEGRVVSIDALAYQTDIAQRITEEGGWYLLAVKDNQSNLHAHLQRAFGFRQVDTDAFRDSSTTRAAA